MEEIKKLRYIYRITNLINGNTYVGRSYFTTMKSFAEYLGSGILIKNAILKYGKENFKKESLILGHYTIKEINELERYYIAEEKKNKKGEYNIHPGGNGAVFWVKHPSLGKKRSDETRRKISLSHQGKIVSEETKLLLSINHADVSGEKNPMYGVPPKIKGGHWYTNNLEEKILFEQPAGWRPGRLPSKIKGKPSKAIGKKWFTNGKKSIMSFECPIGYVEGRRLKND